MGDIIDELGNLMPAPGNGRPKRARIDKEGNFVVAGDLYYYGGNTQRKVVTDGVFNVKSYGATGDGITDDTAAVQAAINAGVTIHFLPGTYIVSSSLQITSEKIIVGNGAIIKGVNLPLCTININTSSPVKMTQIEFNAQNIAYQAGSAIVKILKMSQSVWDAVRIVGIAEHCLEFAANSGVSIANNTFLGMRIFQNTPAGNVCNGVGAYTNVGITDANRFVGGIIGRSVSHADFTQVNVRAGTAWSFLGVNLIGSNVHYAAKLGTVTTSIFSGCSFTGTLGILDESNQCGTNQNFGLLLNTAQTWEVASSSAFVVGDVITGAASAITARVVSKPSATLLQVADKSSGNLFTYGETINGTPSGASTTIRILTNFTDGIKESNGNGSLATFAAEDSTHNTALFLQKNTDRWNTMFINSSGGANNRGILIQQRPTNGTMIKCEAAGTDVFTVDGAGVVNATGEYRIDGTKVLTNQGAAITSVPTGGSANAADNATAINLILARMRTTGGHGLIAD